jgi:hypothetical protein
MCNTFQDLPCLQETADNTERYIQCVQKVLEVMSTSLDKSLNPFKIIRKKFLQICLWDISYVRSFVAFN